MSAFIYRFRPVRALLEDFHELEKQEIYFAPPSELNDPYDGATEVQWSGDPILWTNLLNHYLLCATQAVVCTSVLPEDGAVLNRITASGTADALPSEGAKELYRRVKARFYAQTNARRLPELLAARAEPIGRNELRMYLRVLHTQTVIVALTTMEELGLKNPGPGGPAALPFESAATTCCQMVEVINAEGKAGTARRDVGGVFGNLSESYFYQQSLLHGLDGGGLASDMRGVAALLTDFPAHYVTELEKLLYSDWFTACFVEEATNAAMWGVYGDGHQGVALKFRTQELKGQPALVLNRITGFSVSKGGPARTIRDDVPHVLHQVHYPPRFASIDFFQTMGRITGAESRFWHYDEAGHQSPRSLASGFGTDAWRIRYWPALTAALTTKHEDWAHEHERRIILHDGLVDFGATKENRKLVYRFEDLEGIVFGGKTPAARILEVVRVIREKCQKAGRKNFEFLRAEYSPHEGKMTLLPLSLLKVG